LVSEIAPTLLFISLSRLLTEPGKHTYIRN
jgi:hypothetical protein